MKMMSYGERPPTIEIGDEVEVWFVNGPSAVRGIVHHIARETGECWRIKRIEDDALIYIQSFQFIHLIRRKENASM